MFNFADLESLRSLNSLSVTICQYPTDKRDLFSNALVYCQVLHWMDLIKMFIQRHERKACL